MKVKHYGANAVGVDGVLISYATAVAKIGKDGSFHRLWGGWSAEKEKRRDICRQNYHRAIELGCFLAARQYLRSALMWRSPAARSQSGTWEYEFRNGKVHAFVYKCSF